MKGLDKVFNAETVKTVGDFAKRSFKVVVSILGVTLSSITIADVLDLVRYSGNVKYNDAVKVIMDSNMLPSYKAEIMTILKRDETSEYYKVVIDTVRSSMLGSTKVEIIRNL